MTTKLTSSLPKSDELNGLNAIANDLVVHPDELHVAVVVIDCAKITTDIDTDESTPTARIRRIEVITRADDKTQLRNLATRAFEARTGKTVLPLELEDELRAAFGGSDEDPDPTN
ncbi:hypothetical protein D9V41_09135 [Aeromicrobium phragmitis]|uniref:Uncharacterized protein n=1 Tax=Aeromicrobium phragmitis TaxID=2478914 RepID=A0A3L8PL37_9ACTN|nr:hypothetical protein [Aeromicrobium phragmitis]RLV56041.1 hypothetical protein D9V41_09135 [Aeromicrobium phragmitis]